MSETLSAPLEFRHHRLDEIRRESEVLIDDIVIERATADRGLVRETDDYITTHAYLDTAYGSEIVPGVYSSVELKHGKDNAVDRYQLTIKDLVNHENGVVELNNVTYKFKEDWLPLEAQCLDDNGEVALGWTPDRSEELDLQLYLVQTLQAVQERRLLAA